MDPGIVLTLAGVLAVPLLVLLNGFFVAAEFALVSLRARVWKRCSMPAWPGPRR